ncbi:hypothetical protein DdX_06660 [Ditylenchus destructor]|uniref:Uncharacterized protein n=1 Tax=Ditylenchus destructor TaxID=166010 RepID=A0AAD4NBF7_9BILA|nr:hypothetical protein DdX_06660 [Ditylenchus destructor]
MVVQERRASIATILPLYLALRELPTPDKNLAGVQRAIIKGLDSRMIGWDESEHLVIATLLDPRIKMACFPEDKRATFKDMLLRRATEVSQEAHGTVSETSSDSDINEDSPFAAFMQIYGGNREIEPQEPIDMDAKLKALYGVSFFKTPSSSGSVQLLAQFEVSNTETTRKPLSVSAADFFRFRSDVFERNCYPNRPPSEYDS